MLRSVLQFQVSTSVSYFSIWLALIIRVHVPAVSTLEYPPPAFLPGVNERKVVQLLTLESWVEIMYSTIRSSGENSASLFFVTWVLIGKFTLLSLFLAVILEAFEVAHERQLHERTKTKAKVLLGIGTGTIGAGKCSDLCCIAVEAFPLQFFSLSTRVRHMF